MNSCLLLKRLRYPKSFIFRSFIYVFDYTRSLPFQFVFLNVLVFERFRSCSLRRNDTRMQKKLYEINQKREMS